MLSKTQLSAYQERGFVLGNKVLTDEQVGVLQQEVERQSSAIRKMRSVRSR